MLRTTLEVGAIFLDLSRFQAYGEVYFGFVRLAQLYEFLSLGRILLLFLEK